MRKFVIGTDLVLHILILLVGTAFLIYQNNFFATQMFVICWLPFCINIVFNLASFKEFPDFKQSLWSIFNICFLVLLFAMGKLVPVEFFLSTILGEVVAISLAISYFFLFGRGMKDQKAKEIFGKTGAIILAVLFTAMSYPYIGEAVIYIKKKGFNPYMLMAFTLTLFFGVVRQIKSIRALVARRNQNPDQVDKDLEKALDQSQPMDFDTKVILISIGCWFVGIGAVWAVYSLNA